MYSDVTFYGVMGLVVVMLAISIVARMKGWSNDD